MNEKIHIECSGQSDQGKVRPDNQDHYFIGELSKTLSVRDTTIPVENEATFQGHTQAQVLVVADGIGGRTAGREASQLALDTIIRYILHAMPSYYGMREFSRAELVDNLKSAFLWANERILQCTNGAAGPDAIMGSTLTMAYILWPQAYVVHVGDSRCYLFRQGKLWQVTHDHTVAQQMADDGVLDPSETEGSTWRNGLTNVLGGTGESICDPEVNGVTLADGDALLLCTDGLTNAVPEETIAYELNQVRPTKDICATLIKNADGGDDDATVILARFVSGSIETAESMPSSLEDNKAAEVPEDEPVPA